MVTALSETHVEWTAPAPLWPMTGDPSVAENRRQFRRPAILRFSTDTFMDEFTDLLNTEPRRLSEYVAAPETWSAPAREPQTPVRKTGLALRLERARQAAVRRLESRGALVLGAAQTAAPLRTLKLYQPAHQRFYLVSACLVCRALGLPDRRVDAAAAERVTFVMRMLQPRAGADAHNPDPRDCDELALVAGAWQPAPNPEALIPGEQQLPMAPAAYIEEDRRRRRLYIALIPAADRENLLKAAQPAPGGGGISAPIDARLMLLKAQVIEPWKNLENIAKAAAAAANEPDAGSGKLLTPGQQKPILDRANNQIQAISWYILLDLARYLERYLPNLWQAVRTGGGGAGLPSPQQALLTTFSQTTNSGFTLAQALAKATAAADALETVKTKYEGNSAGWPNFQFRFATAAVAGAQGLTPALGRDVFEGQMKLALGADKSPQPLPARQIARASANPQRPVWFAIRCVLERPNCGALSPPFLSEPTASFQLAAYFDPDAPARPIRIGLPVDTTPAGLRKFDKNTAFVMSDVLCGQVSKMSGVSFGDLIRSVLPFPLHKDLDTSDMQPCGDASGGFGMVCSFSIPIITICALIILIIIVKLLDIVFFWMPFFQICLPLPKFSAKDS